MAKQWKAGGDGKGINVPSLPWKCDDCNKNLEDCVCEKNG